MPAVIKISRAEIHSKVMSWPTERPHASRRVGNRGREGSCRGSIPSLRVGRGYNTVVGLQCSKSPASSLESRDGHDLYCNRIW